MPVNTNPPAQSKETGRLKEIARDLRISTLSAITNAQSGHPGGSLSAAEIITVLYFYKMNIDTQNPKWSQRDHFILSKGHAAPMLYAALARRGFFPEEDLSTLRKVGSHLQGHPDINKTPGVDMSTGSLGQGLSVALGIALANQLSGIASTTYALLGDGELQEGQCWEGAMCAGHFKVPRLVVFLDRNRVQLDGLVEDVMEVGPVTDKWRAFGWQIVEADGHDTDDLVRAVDEAGRLSLDGPVLIVARTVKGKGVSYMENQSDWHGTPPTQQQLEVALDEIRRHG